MNDMYADFPGMREEREKQSAELRDPLKIVMLLPLAGGGHQRVPILFESIEHRELFGTTVLEALFRLYQLEK